MVTVFGIRHHGPGCARSLVRALDALQPDIVLVEGPPDAQEQIELAAHQHMRPPVALVVYQVDAPQRASFYPFAYFSPEWQAMQWALRHKVPVRFADLPCAMRFAKERESGDSASDDASAADPLASVDLPDAVRDPMQWLARADGYSDSERWWNDRIEEGGDDQQLFAAILTAVTALREELALQETTETEQREAYMRRCIRAASKEGFANIAFVCGAWHAPALAASTKAKDEQLLKGLSKVKVRATWSPWTYQRLTSASGYGAGVTSPGWYEHLYAQGLDHNSGSELMAGWLVRAARVFRAHDLEASSASVIEAVRLAESLASLRGRPRPGLPESLEVMRSVFTEGEDAPLQLIERDLLVGACMGELPDGAAQLPLEQDLRAQQKSLRLKPAATVTELALDLREPSGQARSVFLHRLQALSIPWGVPQRVDRARGTFKELWQLLWQPELLLAIVDASAFGSTVVGAASNALRSKGRATAALPERIELLEQSLLADLPDATKVLLSQVETAATQNHDAAALWRSVPPLCRISRYGSVREFDQQALLAITLGLITRTHLALPAAVIGLDDAAASLCVEQLRDYHAALLLLDDEQAIADEQAALLRLSALPSAHAMIRGLACRLLHESGAVELAPLLRLELSAGGDPVHAANWLDGLLRGAGTFLAHDPVLLEVLDGWVEQLHDDAFLHALPLVRRTFATFAGPERQQIAMGLTRRHAPGSASVAVAEHDLDAVRAGPAVAAAARLLGIPCEDAS